MSFPVERILATATVCFMLGIFCGRELLIPLGWLILLAVLLVVGNWLIAGRHKNIPIFLAAFCLGVALITYAAGSEEIWQYYAGQDIVLEGQVVDSPAEKSYIVVDAQTINGQPIAHAGQILVTKPYNDETGFERGSRVRVNGLVKPLLGATNPGGFDSKGYWNSRGVYGQVKSRDAILALAPAQGLWQLTNTIGNQLKNKLGKALPEKQYHLVLALLLGEKGELDPAFYSLSQKLGIAHVFAVSGLHVGFVVAFVLLLLKGLRLERSWVAVVVLAVVLVLYCFMIGLTPSAVRASIMAVLGLLAMKWLRFKDMYTILAIAALVILLAQPQALWSIGFQLSFIATWGLLYLYRPVADRLVFIPWIWLRNALAVSIAAQLASAPLVAWHFYLFSAYAPLINVIIVPVVGLLVPLLLLALCVIFLLPFLGELVFLPCELLMVLLNGLLNGLTDVLGTGHMFIGQPNWWGIIVYFALLIIWRQGWLKTLLPKGASAVLIAALLAVIAVSLPGDPRWDQVVFLDVGQGSSAVAQGSDGRIMVFDGGVTADSTAAFLRYSGVNTIDVIALSHGDMDHTTGLHQLFADFQVKYFLIPANSMEIPEVQLLVAEAHQQQTTIMAVAQRVELQVGEDAYLRAAIYGQPSSDTNEQELSATLEMSGRKMVFPGDMGTQGLLQLTASLAGGVDIWAVPHHGSKNACYPGLYEQLQPRIAVISAGRDNRYGHPHQEILLELEKRQIPYYRTDLEGAITIELRTEGLAVRPYLGLKQ